MDSRSFCLNNISSSTNVPSLKTGPIQQRNRCLSTILGGTPTDALFSHFCLMQQVLKKIQAENATKILITLSWQAPWYPKQEGTSDRCSQSSKGKSSNKTRFSTAPFIGKQKVITGSLGLVVLEKNFLQRDYLEKQSLLSQMQNT